MNQLTILLANMEISGALPAIMQATEKTQKRFLEFFASNIENENTRRAYTRAVADFFMWQQEAAPIRELRHIEPIHVSTWMEQLKAKGLSAPTRKQHLAGLYCIHTSQSSCCKIIAEVIH